MSTKYDERTILGDIEFYELKGQFILASKLRDAYKQMKKASKRDKDQKRTLKRRKI